MNFKRIIKTLGSIFNPTEAQQVFDRQMYAVSCCKQWYDQEELKKKIDENIKNDLSTLIYVEAMGIVAIGTNRVNKNNLFYMQVGFLEDAQSIQPFCFNAIKTSMDTIRESYPNIKEYKTLQNI